MWLGGVLELQSLELGLLGVKAAEFVHVRREGETTGGAEEDVGHA